MTSKVEKTLLFLAVLFLPTQLGRHFWPQFSFVYSLPIDYLSPTFYFWDLLVACLIIVWLTRRQVINKTALNLFLIFILSQTLSLVNSFQIGPGLFRLEQYLICGLLGVYLASSKLEKIKTTIFWALTLAVLGESILAILQFLKGGTLGFWILGERTFSLSTPAIAKFDFYGMQFLRPYATFPHPNVLAAFMIMAGMMLYILGNLSRRKRIWTMLAATAAALTVLITVSRTAIFVGLISAIILLRKKGRIILLLLVTLLLPILYTRFSSAFNFDALSFIRREEQAEIAIKMWLQSPLLGVGFNNFIPAASDQLLAGPNRFLQPVHNIFLLSLAETGVVGFMGLLILIGFPIFRLFKLYPKPYTLNPILLIWGIIIFLGLFDHYFLTLPQGYRMFFLVWGISLAIITSNKHGER